jgi:hypothetical protein
MTTCPECARRYDHWVTPRIAIHADGSADRWRQRVCSWRCAGAFVARLLAVVEPVGEGEDAGTGGTG